MAPNYHRLVTEIEPDVQSLYPEHFAQCYGCGRLNEHGYQLQTRWDGEETVTRFTPAPYHTAIPGYVYGGLLACLIDCHSTATGAAALYREEGRRLVDGRRVTVASRIEVGGEVVVEGEAVVVEVPEDFGQA